LVALDSTVDCENGHFWFPTIDSKMTIPGGSQSEIVAKSSNIGTAKIGLQMGRERLYENIKVWFGGL
jgi:hypothetical protein